MQCEFESRIIQAIRSGAMTDQLQEHVASCPACQETERLALAYRALATETDAVVPPPRDPSLIWRDAFPSQFAPKPTGMLYLISVAVMVMVMITGYFTYEIFFRPPQGTTGSLARLPLGGIPFPNDSGLIIIVIAIALVILLPQIGPSRPKNYTGTMVSL